MLSIIPHLNESKGVKIKQEDYQKVQFEVASAIKKYFNIENLGSVYKITPKEEAAGKRTSQEYKTPFSLVKVTNPITGELENIVVGVIQTSYDENLEMILAAEQQGDVLRFFMDGIYTKKRDFFSTMSYHIYHEMIHIFDPSIEIRDDKFQQRAKEEELEKYQELISQGVSQYDAAKRAKIHRDEFVKGTIEKEDRRGEKDYYNSKVEVVAYFNQLIFELERIRKQNPDVFQKMIDKRNLESLVKATNTWKLVSTHLSPKNAKKVLRGAINSILEKDFAHIGQMSLTNYF